MPLGPIDSSFRRFSSSCYSPAIVREALGAPRALFPARPNLCLGDGSDLFLVQLFRNYWMHYEVPESSWPADCSFIRWELCLALSASTVGSVFGQDLGHIPSFSFAVLSLLFKEDSVVLFLSAASTSGCPISDLLCVQGRSVSAFSEE